MDPKFSEKNGKNRENFSFVHSKEKKEEITKLSKNKF